MRFHFYSVLLWRCQNLELENGGPRVVGPVSVLPFRCVGRAPRSARTRTRCGVLRASASERNSICSVIVPADGTRAATAGKRRLRYVCVFLGSSRTSRCLLVSEHMGCRAQSAMAGRKLNAKHLLGVAQFANCWRQVVGSASSSVQPLGHLDGGGAGPSRGRADVSTADVANWCDCPHMTRAANQGGLYLAQR
jgi:hypothetical protein